ncbi:flagellar basal body-associated FliL family protein [Aquincola sp. MAHUQ-54]|uniref:Flagellar protein FliL n=1 Tax=Aquincola agrisoli TaxID=3119538 RepID=A0AAW9QJD8_9BURK
MKKLQVLVAAGVASVLLLGGGGAAAWWYMKPKAEHVEEAKKTDKTVYKYVNLDKIIVMLRGREGEPLSHYLAVDLVFKTPAEQEKTIKDHLPLLRSVAVKALSAHTLETAGKLTIDQYTDEINAAFAKSYEADHREMPFKVAMIGKLIIE